MPQTFNVVRCFSCSTFQVNQVKKAKKWQCKVCGEKQSLIKVYGQGTGAECRQHVQKLNLLRQDLHEKEYQISIDQDYLQDSEETEQTDSLSFTSGNNGFMKFPDGSPNVNSSSSKWSKFLRCESEPGTSPSQMDESDYVEMYNKDAKGEGSERFCKTTYQEKRKNPFSEVFSRDSYTDSDYLMKKPRTAVKNNFQFSSSVNSDQRNNWSHNVSVESRNPGTNLVTCHRPVHFEHSSSNLGSLTSDKSCEISPSDMDWSKSRENISHTFNPFYTNLPKFTECKDTNDKNELWMVKPQSHLSRDGLEGNDFKEKGSVISQQNFERGLFKKGNDFFEKESSSSFRNVESGHSESLNRENGLKTLHNGSAHTDKTLHVKNLLQRNNIGLSSDVDKQKTDVKGQILHSSSKLLRNEQNNTTRPSLPFSNDLDNEKFGIPSNESNSVENIFQLDESEVDLDF